MLASHRAADLHTEFENFGTKVFGPTHFVWVIGIEQNQWVHVSITRMKHIGATQAILHFHLLYGLEHVTELLARDRAIHTVVVGRDPTGRWEGILAARPEGHALGLRLRHLNANRTTVLEHLNHATDFIFDLGRGAIRFA